MARSLLQLTACAVFILLAPSLYLVSRSRPSSGASDIFLQSDSLHLHGDVIMPKLTNETAKAELGRASWKLLHTMAQRYPERPTRDQREAYASFLHLFSRLYPCGECAAEFQALLGTFPPQTASKSSASMHLCSLHNMVNERLGKAVFDCSKLEGLYDCGCGDEAPPQATKEGGITRDPLTGERLYGG